MTNPALTGIIKELKDRKASVILAAYKQAQDAYQKTPTPANFKALETAENALTCLEKATKSDPANLVVAIGCTQARELLQRRGYKVSLGKIYDDAKRGRLVVEKGSKAITEESLQNYIAHKRGPKPDPVVKKSEAADQDALAASREKQGAELRIQLAKAEKLEHENQVTRGRYMLKADHVMDKIAATGLLDDAWSTKNKILAEEIFQLFGSGGEARDALRLMDTAKDDILIAFVTMDPADVVIA